MSGGEVTDAGFEGGGRVIGVCVREEERFIPSLFHPLRFLFKLSSSLSSIHCRMQLSLFHRCSPILIICALSLLLLGSLFFLLLHDFIK